LLQAQKPTSSRPLVSRIPDSTDWNDAMKITNP
jgi:hypothetical protein